MLAFLTGTKIPQTVVANILSVNGYLLSNNSQFMEYYAQLYKSSMGKFTEEISNFLIGFHCPLYPKISAWT